MNDAPLAAFVNSRLRSEIRAISAELAELRSQVERVERRHKVVDEELARYASVGRQEHKDEIEAAPEAVETPPVRPDDELAAVNRAYQLLLHPDVTKGLSEESSALNAAVDAGQALAVADLIARTQARIGGLDKDRDRVQMACVEYFCVSDQRTLLRAHIETLRASTVGRMLADIDAELSDDELRETIGKAIRAALG